MNREVNYAERYGYGAAQQRRHEAEGDGDGRGTGVPWKPPTCLDAEELAIPAVPPAAEIMHIFATTSIATV